MKTVEAQSIHEEHIALSSGIKGEFQDILLDSNGVIVWERPWQHNLIVNGMSCVLAALIKGDSQGKPLSFWAIGSGVAQKNKLTTRTDYVLRISISEKRNRTELINEIYRKRIEHITFIDAEKNPTTKLSNQLEIKTYFRIGQIDEKAETLELREFGLFAGGKLDQKGNPIRNSGILINHRIHARIELKKGFTLQRTLRITF